MRGRGLLSALGMRHDAVIWQGHVQGESAFRFLSGISQVKCALWEFKLRCTCRDHAFIDRLVTGLAWKFPTDPINTADIQLSSRAADESLMKLAVYFCNWCMFREYMNNIAC